jgi:predicted ATP-dependent protease
MAIVTKEDVEVAWRERRDRAGSAERHIREITLRGELALDTTGKRVGVVNGLSVFSAGDVEFGQPMRITAVVGIGREGIIALSDVPIDQGVAVTGSVNQLGEMQAIGGLCAKIEGFFDLCDGRGLNGTQGVMLPRANLPHLVLREDVAQAIADGRFHLYCVDTVAQGIEILTALPAGERDPSGRFPAASVFGRVERRIIEIAERLREAEAHAFHHDAPEPLDDASAADVMEGGNVRVR